jgi:uncharacterized metal-binding protein YceD (DUF177 family)
MTSDATPPPFERDYDLGYLGRNGTEIALAADAAARARIAAWAQIAAVDSFAAAVRLQKHSANRFSLDADLTAEVVQSCVVTLEPVKERIELQVHRELHLAHHLRQRPNEVIPLAPGAGDDEVPDEIESLHYDLAAPLLEEFTLALNPYPRAPGVEFAAAPEPAPERENPFAVLKSLKSRP